jgi:hypothetical protein
MQMALSFLKDDMTASNAYILISQVIIIFTVLSEWNMTYCRCHVFYNSLVINDSLVLPQRQEIPIIMVYFNNSKIERYA